MAIVKIDGLTPEQHSARIALRLAAGLHRTSTERREFARNNGITWGAVTADNNKALVRFALECLGWTDEQREQAKAAAPQLTLTENEIKALNAIVKSEYQDGGNPVDHDVWTQYVNPFRNKRTQGGVYASLSTKGAIRIGGDYDMGTGHGKMGTVCITQAGFDALNAAKAGK